MTQPTIIKNQQQFITYATDFFHTLFEPSLNASCGEIEIRTFPKKQPPRQFFCQSESHASEISESLCNRGIDVYVGVNPRVGNAGKKQNIHYLAAFHAEVDYGKAGHDKESEYETYEETLATIEKFKMKPTILNHSGGGFHCYWVLVNPVNIAEAGIKNLENINKALLTHLGGDVGTHDITRVLRVPGTFNFKLPDNPREVTNLWIDGPKYSYEDFQWLVEDDQTETEKVQEPAKKISQRTTISSQGIDQLPVSERIKALILNGNDGT